MSSQDTHTIPGMTGDLAERFDSDGFVAVNDLLTPEEVEWYVAVYDRFLSGEIDAGALRSDLGAGGDKVKKGTENITQIMWPSEFVPGLKESVAYERALQLARQWLGDDMAFDFDMLIDKGPGTVTQTPWHQDCAYWVDLPDKRAASCWIALDEATQENGCMWFVAGSHKQELRPHRPAGKGGGALECDGTEEEAVCVPLKPGSCTFHGGSTLHYSRGNSTDGHRRALIINLRPQAMIDLEREQGFDHGKSANVRQNRNDGTR